MEAPASRLAILLSAALLGFLAVLAATRPAGSPRELRRFELADLVEAQDSRVRSLRAELASLRQEIGDLEGRSSGGAAADLRREIDELNAAGGSGALEGPGVVVTLDDSSSARSPSGDPNDLVVHEADIQTVVNALWSAGAEVVAVNGERLTAGSAVRCAGNTLLLHGTLHTPPYRIAAIGEPQALAAALPSQPGMSRLAAASQAFGLELDIESATIELEAGPVVSRSLEARPVEAA